MTRYATQGATVATESHPLAADAAARSPLLRVSGLSVDFAAEHALADIDVTINEGELVALAGEPGAGKTTLIRCIAGDLTPDGGRVVLAGRPVSPGRGTRRGHRIGVVWQDLALCENLDVAGNLLLGQETRRLMLSESRFHAAAASLLESLEIPIRDTTRLVGALSAGQRQLVAVARAVAHAPRLLVLDEPTASLGGIEAGRVEELITSLRAQGTTILLSSRDIDQMFRLADRIVVLRHGRIVADLDPQDTHPDDLGALLSGQEIDSWARGQLTRLHGLADRLVSADPSSSLSLILSALGAALGTETVCIHVVSGGSLDCAASLGFAPGQIARWSRLPFGAPGGPAGRAAAHEQRVVEEDLRSQNPWDQFGKMTSYAPIVSSWSVPVMGQDGVSAVITVFRPQTGGPDRDELDLLTLYAGYAASVVERDRLLEQVTARNRVLETIREMLETLAGPVTVANGLVLALQSLRRGLRAEEVALRTRPEGEGISSRAYVGPSGTEPDTIWHSANCTADPWSTTHLSSRSPDDGRLCYGGGARRPSVKVGGASCRTPRAEILFQVEEVVVMLSRIRNRPLSSRALGGGGWPMGLLVVALLAALGLFGSAALAAQPTVGLGTADSFAVLAGSAVTNTGPSTVNGDLGVSPGAAVTGFPPGTVHGTIHAADAGAGQAQSDLTTAYNDAAARTPAATVSGDLGGRTLTAGVYKSASSLGLTGALTLNAQGNPNAVFIFQAGSTLTTASGSHVNLINGAQPCNVFWQIGSSATLGTSSVLSGNILALTSISIDNGVTVLGRALARNGAVTLINDTITAAHCATGGGGTGGHKGTAVLTTVPRSVARTVGRFGTGRCVGGTFRAVVTGRRIRRVVFSRGGRTIATRSKSPFGVSVKTGPGIHTLRAAVTFTDGTRAKTLRLRFRSCASVTRPVVSAPPVGPPGFTG